MEYAYCWRSGRIEFGDRIPEGALPIGRGGKAFRAKVEVYARHSRGNKWLLVPGIPEAATEKDALLARRLFIKLVDGKKISRGEIRASRAAQERSFDAIGKAKGHHA